MSINKLLPALAALCLLAAPRALAQEGVDVDYEGTLTVNAGTHELAPYYIASNRGGTVTQQYGVLASASAWHTMDTTRRWSYGFGAEVWASMTSSADYDRYDAQTHTFFANSQHPARAWLEQLYAEAKYRGVFAQVGGQRLASPLVNGDLSSGDLTMSGNARAPFGARAGFVNFQNIPFTHGWVQIAGEIGYYKYGDKDWLENHYNQCNNFVTSDLWFNYKYAYFRTSPTQPVVVTVGMQAAYQFGGTQRYWRDGTQYREVKMETNAKAFFRGLVPGSGGTNNNSGLAGDTYVEGNHVGTWDVAVDYKWTDLKATVRFYHQHPWEDGSGVGWQNGLDGLWGLEYRSDHRQGLTGAVIEYVDLTNQSGPVHWASADRPGTPIHGNSTGNDNYYNNYAYNGYQAYGMSIGSPFVKSPLYNTDGYLGYADNVMRGFHMGVTGCVTNDIDYRALFSYRRAWGTCDVPRRKFADDYSLLLEATMRPRFLPHCTVKGQVAFDLGDLYGDNFGTLLTITYHGNFNFGRR